MPADKTILRLVADNPQLFDVLKQTLLDQFEVTGVVTDTDTNEILGQQLRSYLEGRQKVEQAFRQIATYKTSNTGSETKNPAR